MYTPFYIILLSPLFMCVIAHDLSNPDTAHVIGNPPIPSDQDTMINNQNSQFTDKDKVESQVETQPDLEYGIHSTAVQPTTLYRGVAKGVSQGYGQAISTDTPPPLNAEPSANSAYGAGYGISSANSNSINANQNNGISAQAPPANDFSTSALNSSRNFFSQAISQACVRHCTTWKTQSDLCSDDRCLCTDDTIYTAGVCTDCVGDSGQGGRIGTCYSEFVNACQVQAVGTTGGIAGQGTMTDQLSPSTNPNLQGQVQQGSSAQDGLPYGYGSTSTIPLQGSRSSLTTQYVTATATAGAMIAAETVVVDSDSGSGRVVSGGRVIVGSILALALGLAMM